MLVHRRVHIPGWREHCGSKAVAVCNLKFLERGMRFWLIYGIISHRCPHASARESRSLALHTKPAAQALQMVYAKKGEY